MVSSSFVPPPFDKALAHCVEARESYRVAKVPCPAPPRWAVLAALGACCGGMGGGGRVWVYTALLCSAPARCCGCGLLQKYLSMQCKVIRRLTRRAPGAPQVVVEMQEALAAMRALRWLALEYQARIPPDPPPPLSY